MNTDKDANARAFICVHLCSSVANSICLVAVLFLTGCCNCPKTTTTGGERLNPPTQAMAMVVNAINANNEKIPSLWATLNYSATINVEGHVHSVSGDDGVLLYQAVNGRPTNLRLRGNKEFVGPVFDMGCNGRQFWVEVVPGAHTMWWGNYDDLRRLKPDRLPIPVRPDLVLEVLGVRTIQTDFRAMPAPIMRYDGAADAYVFLFAVEAPDRWYAQKEVYYDRGTLRPRRVVLYDLEGRPVLDARLSKDVKVTVDGQGATNWPLVAGDYKLFFPDSGSRMEFTLKDVRLEKAGPRGMPVPNENSFRLPDVQGTEVEARQIGGGGSE